MNRNWADVGIGFLRDAFLDSRRLFVLGREQERVNRQIQQLEWHRPTLTSCVRQHHLIAVISRKHFTEISAVADNGQLRCPEGEGWRIHPLVAVEGMHLGQRKRLYVLDVGRVQMPLAMDVDVQMAEISSIPPHGHDADGVCTDPAARIAADYPGLEVRLDERVHEWASQTGTQINNSGLLVQVAYLLEQGDSEESIRDLLSGN